MIALQSNPPATAINVSDFPRLPCFLFHVCVVNSTKEHRRGIDRGKEDKEDERGSKRSLDWFFRWLEGQGHNSAALWREVASLVVKTLATAQPSLARAYRACLCGETRGGVDVVLKM